MTNKENSNFYPNWYEQWMKQNKEFFESANKNLKDHFEKNSPFRPEEHLKQVNEWLETMKKQWEFAQLSDEQKAYQQYWNTWATLCNEASELLRDQWVKRSQENKPVNNINELYELWLNCCQEVYQRSLQSKTFQDAYKEMMNSAVKFWESTVAK